LIIYYLLVNNTLDNDINRQVQKDGMGVDLSVLAAAPLQAAMRHHRKLIQKGIAVLTEVPVATG